MVIEEEPELIQETMEWVKKKKKKNRVSQIDYPSPNSLLKSCVKTETKVITQSVVMFNVCKRSS